MIKLVHKPYQIQRIKTADTWPIRQSVMWPDRPIEYIILENDTEGEHFGLFRDKLLITVVSLFLEEDRAQFRKFATIVEEQGKGYGTILLKYLIDYAKSQNVVVLWCNARKDKVPYYNKFGFQMTDRTFTKGGLDYVIIEKQLHSTR